MEDCSLFNGGEESVLYIFKIIDVKKVRKVASVTSMAARYIADL
jgi:hypothetical protein